MKNQIPPARAAIFDLDGTLLDTLGDLTDSVNAALAAHGYPTHTDDAVRGFIGDGAASLIQRAMPDGAGDDAKNHAACLASFENHYDGNFANRTSPYPGVMALLGELHQRGVPLGILSNKPHAFTVKCAAAYFSDPEGLFRVILGQRDGIPKKPDPAGALEAAATLGVSAGECLYIGDSGVDMKTALAAGMAAIGVGWGFRSAEELAREGATAVIEAASDLLAGFAD